MLVGCATTNVVNEYAIKNKPLAEQGLMKWSDYYKGAYDQTMNSNVTNKGRTMGRLNVLIQAAQSYEANAITKDQFDHLRREAQAANTIDNEDEERRRRLAMLEALKEMSAANARNNATSGYQIVPPAKTTRTNCNSLGGQFNCTSTTN